MLEYSFDAEPVRIAFVVKMHNLGATGFDVGPESIGCRSSWADSLNSSTNLTANTYQENLALAA